MKECQSSLTLLENTLHRSTFCQLNWITDVSVNHLSNGSSQDSQVIFLTNSNNKCCSIYWNSSTIKRILRSTIIDETLSLRRYNTVAVHVFVHLFIISINSHSYKRWKQPQITFRQYSCSVTMINIVKKYL